MGAGSGLGPEITFYNRNFLGHGINVEVPLLYTYNRYQLYRFSAALPIIGNSAGSGRLLTFDVGTACSSRARDNLFTLGNDSPLSTESQVRLVGRNIAVGFSARLSEKFHAGLHETYRNVGVTNPVSGINGQVFLRNAGIPDLATGATILSTVLMLDHDRREQTDVIGRDNIEHLEISFNQSAGNGGDFGYWKYHLEAQHFFPLNADRRTAIALRLFAETNQLTHGQVPFFDMPAVGSWETLRGYENFRFRDTSALSLTAEYRYRIWRFMDWGFFLDAGQVAPHPGDFGWNRFQTGYGFRWFIYLKPTFPVAIDVAHSSEKSAIFYINFNTTF
jgi:outer membrane protein assembly factor BamA